MNCDNKSNFNDNKSYKFIKFLIFIKLNRFSLSKFYDHIKIMKTKNLINFDNKIDFNDKLCKFIKF